MADRIITPDTFARNRNNRRRSFVAERTGGNIRNDSGGASTYANPTGGNTSPTPTGPLQGTDDGSVTYASGFSAKTRNKPIQDRLFNMLVTAARSAGVRVIITSGGQDSPGPRSRRTGSRRHDNGYAVDVQLYNGGTLLYTSNDSHLNIIITFCRAARQAGVTAIGAGNGYMNNRVLHLDIAAGQPGVSNARFWGGTAMNAAGTPSWLRQLMS
jgi:hypothetical protein